MMFDKNSSIGVFDSGVGGLSVLTELVKLLPHEKFLYFGDTLRVPYGDKSIDELVVCTKRILDFFKNRNVKAVIVACNTCSANTLELVKNDYDFKILGLIEPTCEYIREINVENIGLIATQATVNSNTYKKVLESYGIKLLQQACPELVKFVERGELDSKQLNIILSDYLKPLLNDNIENLILGCTHYPFLIPAMKKLGLTDEMFINPAICISQKTKEFLEDNNLLTDNLNGSCEFFVSGKTQEFTNNSQLFFPKKIEKVTQIL